MKGAKLKDIISLPRYGINLRVLEDGDIIVKDDTGPRRISGEGNIIRIAKAVLKLVGMK